MAAGQVLTGFARALIDKFGHDGEGFQAQNPNKTVMKDSNNVLVLLPLPLLPLR